LEKNPPQRRKSLENQIVMVLRKVVAEIQVRDSEPEGGDQSGDLLPVKVESWAFPGRGRAGVD